MDLLNRLAKIYISPDTEFPSPRGPGLHRSLLRRAHRRRGHLGVNLALNSGIDRENHSFPDHSGTATDEG